MELKCRGGNWQTVGLGLMINRQVKRSARRCKCEAGKGMVVPAEVGAGVPESRQGPSQQEGGHLTFW